jgi:hypothetical protein
MKKVSESVETINITKRTIGFTINKIANDFSYNVGKADTHHGVSYDN